jgi:hypothetical protein
MVEVKLIKTLIGSPMRHSGTTIEVSEEEAKRLVSDNIAIPVSTKEVESKESKEVKETRAVHSNKQARRRTNKSKRG